MSGFCLASWKKQRERETEREREKEVSKKNERREEDKEEEGNRLIFVVDVTSWTLFSSIACFSPWPSSSSSELASYVPLVIAQVVLLLVMRCYHHHYRFFSLVKNESTAMNSLLWRYSTLDLPRSWSFKWITQHSIYYTSSLPIVLAPTLPVHMWTSVSVGLVNFSSLQMSPILFYLWLDLPLYLYHHVPVVYM